MTEVLPGPGRGRLVSTHALRALLMLAALLAASAVLVGLIAVHSHPRQVVVPVRQATATTAVTTDATGCPVDRQCAVRSSVAPQTLTAVTTAYPTAQVRSAYQTVDATDARVYQVTMVVQFAASARGQVVGRCVPGGARRGLPAVRTTPFTHVDLAGDSVVDHQLMTVTAPGGPGCSVLVTVDQQGATPPPAAPATALAASLAARLSS